MDTKSHITIANRIASGEGFYKIAQDPAYTGVAFRLRARRGITPLDMLLRGYERDTIVNEVVRYAA